MRKFILILTLSMLFIIHKQVSKYIQFSLNVDLVAAIFSVRCRGWKTGGLARLSTIIGHSVKIKSWTLKQIIY